ncbi:hypothetical protein C0J52_14174 [Blattella germanica]|nr:hypothetical protein C0J52_14174 [Blattella germanica]
MMALPSKSRALTASEIIKILEDPIDENVRICDSGSEVESDDDVLDDFQSDNNLISSENEEEIASEDEDLSALNDVGQRVKRALICMVLRIKVEEELQEFMHSDFLNVDTPPTQCSNDLTNGFVKQAHCVQTCPKQADLVL